MDVFDGLSQAFLAVQSWSFFLAFLLGCANGIIFGILPGLSGSVGIALMIPFTYGMDPAAAMALFVAALAGQTFAGSVTAILLNTPGTSPNAATTFDGYPLARQGRAGFAIGISATASFLGALVGVVVLLALFPVVRSIILAFSFPEFAMLGVLGLAAIAVAARGSVLKGVISGLIGLLISFIGFAPIGGDLRYVFGQATLFDGIGVVPVLIGMFAVAEALRLLSSNERVAKDVDQLRFGSRQVWEGVVYTVKRPFLLIRSALLGTVIGIVPAVGGTVAAFLAYFQGSRTVKNPKFGQGDPRGVLAPEAANNAKDSGAALPTLAFGIPGSADWAVILGAMIIHGITPGPNLITDSPDIVWVAILVIVASCFVASAIGLIAAPKLVQLTRLRPSLLAPIVVVLAVSGAFALELRTLDVFVAIGFGLLGYAMKAIGMPVIPLILGLILGPIVERSFIQTLSTFGASGFVTRPISLILILLVVAIIAYEVAAARRMRQRNAQSVEEGIRSASRPQAVVLVGGLGVVAAAALILAIDFTPDSRLFPLVAAGLTVALSAIYVLVALNRTVRSRIGGIIADAGSIEQISPSQSPDEPDDAQAQARSAEYTSGDAAEADREPSTVMTTDEPELDEGHGRRLTISAALLAVLALATNLFGLAVAIPITLVLFLRLVGRETWRLTSILSAVTVILLYVTFVAVLNVPLEGGTLLTY